MSRNDIYSAYDVMSRVAISNDDITTMILHCSMWLEPSDKQWLNQNGHI